MSAAVPDSEMVAVECVASAETKYSYFDYDSVEAQQRRAWHLHWFLLIAASIVVFLATFLNVHQATQVRLPWLQLPLPELCYFKVGTGIDCPGCGLTRSFISFAHGQFALAWHYNPAGALFFPVVAFQIPYRVAQLLRVSRGLPSWNLGKLAYGVFAGLFLTLLVQWVAKLLSLW
jgi:hypothetical protein